MPRFNNLLLNITVQKVGTTVRDGYTTRIIKATHVYSPESSIPGGLIIEIPERRVSGRDNEAALILAEPGTTLQMADVAGFLYDDKYFLVEDVRRIIDMALYA